MCGTQRKARGVFISAPGSNPLAIPNPQRRRKEGFSMQRITIVINNILLDTVATEEECEQILDILDSSHSDLLGENYIEVTRQKIADTYSDH